MRNGCPWFLLLVALAPPGLLAGHGAATQPACADELASEVADVLRQTGPAYATARDRLLAQDAASLRPCLEARRRQAEDPLEQLGVEALLARLSCGRAVDEVIAKVIASLPEGEPIPATTTSRPASSDLVRPSQVALSLAECLGDDLTALAAELLTRNLVKDWAIGRRQALILTLPAVGQVRQAHGKLIAAREPRAGHVLLWLLEHEDDEPRRRLVAQGLRRFASPPMIAAVRALDARVRSESSATRPASPATSHRDDARQATITQCLRGMEAEQRILDRLRPAQTSQPAPAR